MVIIKVTICFMLNIVVFDQDVNDVDSSNFEPWPVSTVHGNILALII